VLKLPWQTFSNLIIVCCYDNEPTILNIDTACNKLKCKMANSIFHNYVPIIFYYSLNYLMELEWCRPEICQLVRVCIDGKQSDESIFRKIGVFNRLKIS
jgi:hypothetical protein